ncbi:hypothetical protein GCM10007877_01060 [Marinibactrum halimedae]|uniref:Uncharacterized protein n=1 Tax=Marinibactrum halimedae TaxID=1444977 RepID=A0AA37WKQ2_9GAMM|nr:hypothetical protein GCM10007877_01060 [Marinibactrum halimedae]
MIVIICLLFKYKKPLKIQRLFLWRVLLFVEDVIAQGLLRSQRGHDLNSPVHLYRNSFQDDKGLYKSCIES